jgi:hypothetical protein
MADKGWEGWTLRDGDVVIKGLTPYLIVGDLGIRQERHQAFQPTTVPRDHLQFLVLDAGLSVFRDGESVGRPGQRLEEWLVRLAAKIDAAESRLHRDW